MAPKGTVFLLGPGFIGLEILTLLVAEGYSVTTLVRRDEARANLENMGSKTAKGSLDDHDFIRDMALKNDITIHTATADHKPSVMAIMDGIDARAALGKSTIYLHTSGCSVLTDNSAGKFASDKIYEDNKPDFIDTLPEFNPHRQVDLSLLERRKQVGAKAKVSIFIPPVIYGLGKDNRLSIQIPTMARFALKHGYAGFPGGGKAVWGQIHVRDLAKGYMTALHYSEDAAGEEVLKQPYFFAENGDELSWEQMAEIIGTALHKAGKIEDPKLRVIPEALYGDLFQDYTLRVVGENARNRANRLRALGWKAQEKPTAQSFIEDELPVLLAEKGDYKGYTAAVAS